MEFGHFLVVGQFDFEVVDLLFGLGHLGPGHVTLNLKLSYLTVSVTNDVLEPEKRRKLSRSFVGCSKLYGKDKIGFIFRCILLGNENQLQFGQNQTHNFTKILECYYVENELRHSKNSS